jgi:Flp pilus assembly protein TadD
MDQQKEDTALIYFRQAVFIAPGFSKAYQDLGDCLTRLGRPEEAYVYHLKATRIDPARSHIATNGITTKEGAEGQSVPGYCLTCLVW